MMSDQERQDTRSFRICIAVCLLMFGGLFIITLIQMRALGREVGYVPTGLGRWEKIETEEPESASD